MRELSRREFYLLLFCPVVLVFAIYYIAFDGRAQKSVTQLEQGNIAQRRSIYALNESIATARVTPVPPIPLAKQELALLSKQVETEKRLAEISAHPGSMVPIRWTSVTGRIEAVHAIESAFENNGLIIVSRQTDADAQNVVPKELGNFAAAIKSDGNHPIPEVWRFNVIGSYNDVLTSLDELGRNDGFIIPLAAEMKVLPGDTTRRIWSLWIWV
jgi:hypothetical protein